MKRNELLVVLIMPLLILVSPLAQAQPYRNAKTFLKFNTGSMAKVGTTLAQLHHEHAVALNKGVGAPFTPSNPLIRVNTDQVVIDAVASHDTDTLRTDLEALGLQQTATFGRIVSGWLPIRALDQVAVLASLQFARPAYMMLSAGSVVSQGVAAMGADEARARFGVDGTGVTVGTVSDSFDCLHALDPMVPGAEADVASGDLPSGIVVLDDLMAPGCRDAGRAMMQLIMDVAPGAKQAFHTAAGGLAEFALAIQELAGCPQGSEAGCTPALGVAANVIVDDVTFLTEPMFQDGIVAQAVDLVHGAGVAYFAAAGNNGRNSYETPSGFMPSSVIGPSGGPLHDFDPGPGDDPFQNITIPLPMQGNPGEPPERSGTAISFQWDSPFASVCPGCPGSPNDLNIYLMGDGAGRDTIVASGAASNVGGDAVEVLGFINDGSIDIDGRPGPDTTFNIVIELVPVQSSGRIKSPGLVLPPGLMKYVRFDIGPGVTVNEFDTASSTIFGHAGAKGAETVGAAFWRDTPVFGTDPPILEPFSGTGLTSILFETGGTPTFELRTKPEIVGPDGVNTTFFGFDFASDPDSNPNFSGTSAAAPHAAAVAALMLEANRRLAPDMIYKTLESTAIDMDDPITSGFDVGFDFGTGFGLIQAAAALESPADLAVAQSDEPDPVNVGEQVTHTITVANNGPNDAQNVVVTNTLPSNVTFVSATPNRCSESEVGGVVTCSLDSVPNGSSVNVVIVSTTTQGGTMTNTVRVASDTGDPDTDNNEVVEQTKVIPVACPEDVLLSNYQTTAPQFVEVANVGDDTINLDGCTLVVFNVFTERSIEDATVALDGMMLNPGETSQVPISGIPAGPGAIRLYNAPPPPNGTRFSIDNQITGMIYLDNNTVFAISHLTIPEHNDIYDCIYGGQGNGPFSRPFNPLEDCLGD